MNSKKEYPKQQHCPACNRYAKHLTRYTNYACGKCVAKAIDTEGWAISF